MLSGIIFEVIICVMLLTPSVLEVIANKCNPIPRMNSEKDEERIIFCNKIKTREMYESIKR